jgi:hypothetical protein
LPTKQSFTSDRSNSCYYDNEEPECALENGLEMLHELLLSLSGYQSDIFDKVKGEQNEKSGVHAYISEPERAMLETLSHIAQLHTQIKQAAGKIANGHPSVVCRAVAAAISDTHLRAFRTKIIQVEAAILQKDSSFVGGYDIVPLSTIVSEFAPWARKLEWLLNVTQFMNEAPKQPSARSYCTSRDLLDFLLSQTWTGYSDLEDMATSLLIVAQKSWMRCTASWLLYGKLPAFGTDDFFICWNQDRTSTVDEHLLDHALLPSFVTRTAAESILAIGNALNQLQNLQDGDGKHLRALLPQHLSLLNAIKYPLNESSVQMLMVEIDTSISRNALSHILPMDKIAGILNVVHRFMLLCSGEFATILIEHCAERIKARQTAPIAKPVRKAGRVEDLGIKDAELAGILSKIWDELASLRNEHDIDDETADLARQLLTLRTVKDADQASIPICTLMPSITTLQLTMPPTSSLKHFLIPKDADSYAGISSYLLSVRRTELNLSHLWKLTSQRRCHPTPLGPPVSASEYGKKALLARRTREQSRSVGMRQHWATASKALFVVNELDAYLHSEVIDRSWQHFQSWLHDGARSRPSSSRSTGSRPATANSAQEGRSDRPVHLNDPRTLAKGHHSFLAVLKQNLLLEDEVYIAALKELLHNIDHYIALFSRLSSIWSGLDLEEDDGVVDAFSNYREEEKSVLEEMGRCRMGVEKNIEELVTRLKNVEDQKDSIVAGLEELEITGPQKFVPWRGRSLDRLIVKLGYLTGEDEDVDGEISVDDDG